MMIVIIRKKTTKTITKSNELVSCRGASRSIQILTYRYKEYELGRLKLMTVVCQNRIKHLQ